MIVELEIGDPACAYLVHEFGAFVVAERRDELQKDKSVRHAAGQANNPATRSGQHSLAHE